MGIKTRGVYIARRDSNASLSAEQTNHKYTQITPESRYQAFPWDDICIEAYALVLPVDIAHREVIWSMTSFIQVARFKLPLTILVVTCRPARSKSFSWPASGVADSSGLCWGKISGQVSRRGSPGRSRWWELDGQDRVLSKKLKQIVNYLHSHFLKENQHTEKTNHFKNLYALMETLTNLASNGTGSVGLSSKTELKYPLRWRSTLSSQTFFFEPSTRTHKSSLWSGRVEIGMWSPWLWCEDKFCETKGETLLRYNFWPCRSWSRCPCHPSPWKSLQQLLESPTITASIVNGGDLSTPKPKLFVWFGWLFTKSSVTLMAWKFVSPDLDHSRVAKSNMQNLETFGSNPFYFAGPDEWRSAEFEDYGFVTIDEVIEEVWCFCR